MREQPDARATSYRDAAKDLRVRASTVKHPKVRDEMCALAAEYERLAECAESPGPAKGKRKATAASIKGWARAQDFFSRHGGSATREAQEREVEKGARGWWEVYARDGYRLHCDWVRSDQEEQLTFSELPP